MEISGSSDAASPRNKTFIFIQQAVIQQRSNILRFALRAKHKTEMGFKDDASYSVWKSTHRYWQLRVHHNFKSLQVIFPRIWEPGAAGKSTMRLRWEWWMARDRTQPAMPRDLRVMYFPTETRRQLWGPRKSCPQ